MGSETIILTRYCFQMSGSK